MPYRAPIHKPAQAKAPRHNPRGKDATNRQQRRAMHTGSKAWRLLRESILARDGFTCADCGYYGDQVDHIDGNSHNNDPSNLATRCLRCHSSKTMREINAQGLTR